MSTPASENPLEAYERLHVHFTVYVRPPEAEGATRVKLTQMEVPVCSWPPNGYRQAFAVKPRRYWLEAESEAGTVEPAQRRLDAREEDKATIEIRPSADGILGVRTPSEPGPSPPHLETRRDRTKFMFPPPAPL